MSTNIDALLGAKIRKLCDGGQFDLTDSPKSMVDAVVRLCAETAASEPEPQACQACGVEATRHIPEEATDFPGAYCNECGPGGKPEPQAQAGEPEVVRIDPAQDPMRPAYFMGYSENETPAEMVLRKLACWLGVGGYNAPKVDAEKFHEKIVWAIEHLQGVESSPSIAKKDAALKACVDAGKAVVEAQETLSRCERPSAAFALSEARLVRMISNLDAAITQAQDALK